MNSGRPPALNDCKGRRGDQWILGGGLLPKYFVAHAVMVCLKSAHWSVESARA